MIEERKSIKIKIPKGYKIDEEKSTSTEIVFKKIDTLPTSWDEVENFSGYYLFSDGIISKAENVAGVFPYYREAEAVDALAKLSHLRKMYVKDWVPSWKGDAVNYVILLDAEDKTFDVASTLFTPRFLNFPTRNMAETFLKNFEDLIKKASPLLFGFDPNNF